MREEKPKFPSQMKKSVKKKNWFWPVVYSGIAIVFVGMIWGYSAFLSSDNPGIEDTASNSEGQGNEVIVETNAQKETLKYPFAEASLDDVAILQEYYDMEADEGMREKGLLVFNQKYVTSTGLSISIGDKPFEVIAAMSGVVEDVITDVFQGDEIILKHADGMQTVYSSVTGILVKKGDEVEQGDPLATASSNEWNPTAGTHLHFEVLEDGEPVNPRTSLAF